ncbi:MAG: hypothetical protein RR954_06460, partial [Christensenellaceae bacterium]
IACFSLFCLFSKSKMHTQTYATRLLLSRFSLFLSYFPSRKTLKALEIAFFLHTKAVGFYELHCLTSLFFIVWIILLQYLT